MDGNQDDLHIFREQEYNGKCCTPLGFHYNTSIDGSIASMVDAWDMVNIHKHKNFGTPPTQSSGSTQIYFIFLSAAAVFFRCGILDFNTLFSSDRRPLYIDIDIFCLLGYPVYGTIRALERDLKLNNPLLTNAYQATIIQHLLNQNAGPRVDALYIVDPSLWASHHESRFNSIDRDV
jgi:hypothetical protein